ncbi:RNA polymerase factor sigma-54 [Ureibacillus composti]
MDLSMHLQQKMETKLALSPQLKQALSILKFSMQELENYIRDEANANPLIEINEQHDRDMLIEMSRLHQEEVYSFTNAEDESFDPLTLVASKDESIELSLMAQLAMQKHLERVEKEVILYYIRSLNGDGYLDCDVEEVADYFDLPISQCENLLEIFQSFEPAGIGARSLLECLVLQLKRKEDAPKLSISLVQNHLEDLAEQRFDYLAQLFNTSEEEVLSVLSYIQTLNPHPLIETETEKTEYIVPDLIVEEFNGEYIIQINDRYLPKVSINKEYEELLRANANEETNDYLKSKLSDALLLMKGIEQRHETLYKVTKVILDKQKPFLQSGKKALQPLRLKDVAEIVGLHESTISRAISDKYIQAPQGVFPLKALFMRGVKTESGTVESIITIKDKIKAIIENENVKKPYSDQKIANLLLLEGIQIARRTVAKYREELGFLQSTKRVRNSR